jgi:hypothetical protein
MNKTDKAIPLLLTDLRITRIPEISKRGKVTITKKDWTLKAE